MSLKTTATAVAKYYCLGSLLMIWEFRVQFCLHFSLPYLIISH